MQTAVTLFVNGKSIANSATLLCASFTNLARIASERNPPPPPQRNTHTHTINKFQDAKPILPNTNYFCSCCGCDLNI